MAATLARQTEAVRALLDAGADVDIRDDRLDNPFLYAGAEGLLDILRLANEAGADPALTNRFGGIALIPASERGHVEVVRYLLDESDVDVDHVNNLGWTALLEAVILADGGPAHQAIVRMLLDAGADPELADGDGVTPLAHARSRGQDAVAAILVAAGADRRRSRSRLLPRQLEVRERGEHRLAADLGVLERDLDLLVVAGQLRGDHDPVAPAGVADAVAVAVAALPGDDRAGRDGPRSRGRARQAATRDPRRGSRSGGTRSSQAGSRRPAVPATRTAPRPRTRRASPRGRVTGGTPRRARARPAARSPAGTRRRRPGSPRRAASRARGTRGPGPGPRRGRPPRGAAARPSAPAGSRAGTATGSPSRRRPTSRAARRGTGTAAASPA